MDFSRDELEGLRTPCFIFDEAELRKNFLDFDAALRASWGEEAHVAYSVKTNPFPWILDVARDCGCLAEVVSDDEYDLALSRGFAPSQIVFNGPVKGRAWLAYALRNGSYVNLDSHRELRWVEELAPVADGLLKVGVRVNIDLDSFIPGETITGANKGRFGFSYEGGEVGEVISRLKAIPNVRVSGLHMHVTTLSRSTKAYEVLAEHAVKVIRECDLVNQLEYVDMGGGYYGGGPLNVGKYEAYAQVMSDVLRRACDPSRVGLLVEPGGAVVCTPGYYVGRVVDAKDVLGHRFVVSELSRLNIDHEMKKTKYVHQLYTASDKTMPEQVLCGFTCMESDRLCKLCDEPELAEGDFVLMRNAGAYSMSFTPGFFIENAPWVYVAREDGFHLVRAGFHKLPPKA